MSDAVKALREKQAEWRRHFHEMSNDHFGGIGEHLGNVERICADELDPLVTAVEREMADLKNELIATESKLVLKVARLEARLDEARKLAERWPTFEWQKEHSDISDDRSTESMCAAELLAVLDRKETT